MERLKFISHRLDVKFGLIEVQRVDQHVSMGLAFGDLELFRLERSHFVWI